jgi:hypothetical protein
MSTYPDPSEKPGEIAGGMYTVLNKCLIVPMKTKSSQE